MAKEVKNLKSTVLIITGGQGENDVRFEPKEEKKIDVTDAVRRAEENGYVRIGFKNPISGKKVDEKKEVKK